MAKKKAPSSITWKTSRKTAPANKKVSIFVLIELDLASEDCDPNGSIDKDHARFFRRAEVRGLSSRISARSPIHLTFPYKVPNFHSRILRTASFNTALTVA
jgi:hypothetical protein